jgi:hypothetical protein
MKCEMQRAFCQIMMLKLSPNQHMHEAKAV